MPKPAARHVRARLILGVVFILSVLALLVGLRSGSPNPPAPGSPSAEPPGEALLVWLPLLTAATSLLGLVSTTALAWRADRRASGMADLERQRQALELERAKAELERLKASQRPGEESGTQRRDEIR